MQNKSKGTELTIFKGRQAKLNRAIIKTLSNDSPKTIYDIRKQLTFTKQFKRVRYGNVHTRVKALEKCGYLQKAGSKSTRSGFNAILYTVTSRSLFALLISSLDLNNLILELDEISTISILSTIMTHEQI